MNTNLDDSDRETLLQFFCGNFHQDCGLQHSTYDSVISQFMSDARESDKVDLLVALKKLHDSEYGEKKIEKMICNEFGCAVWPVKLRGRPWIQEIIGRLEKEIPNKTLVAIRPSAPRLSSLASESNLNPNSTNN